MEQHLNESKEDRRGMPDSRPEQKPEAPQKAAAAKQQNGASARSSKKPDNIAMRKRTDRTESDGHDYIL